MVTVSPPQPVKVPGELEPPFASNASDASQGVVVMVGGAVAY